VQTEKSKSQRKFQGILSSLAKIWREEGMRGYFKGNGTNVVRIVPYVAVQFASYEEYKKVGPVYLIHPSIHP
jgi:solute carrier family 25 phosphate transporter 23/24/25/41